MKHQSDMDQRQIILNTEKFISDYDLAQLKTLIMKKDGDLNPRISQDRTTRVVQ